MDRVLAAYIKFFWWGELATFVDVVFNKFIFLKFKNFILFLKTKISWQTFHKLNLQTKRKILHSANDGYIIFTCSVNQNSNTDVFKAKISGINRTENDAIEAGVCKKTWIIIFRLETTTSVAEGSSLTGLWTPSRGSQIWTSAPSRKWTTAARTQNVLIRLLR